jgi:hypothetical protein
MGREISSAQPETVCTKRITSSTEIFLWNGDIAHSHCAAFV